MASPLPDVPDATGKSNAEEKRTVSPMSSEASDVMEALEKPVTYSLPNQVNMVDLMGIPIVALTIDAQERLCLAQISSTLLKQYSYNEIHNRRVALGITCVQCTPVQLEILRRAGAMPVSSRRCGMITKREAERLCKSFLTDNSPPKLPENFTFDVCHRCAWGSRGKFMPSRYNSSRAKCIQCVHCRIFFSPNKFIFHSHRFNDSEYTQPDAANFNSWRRHLHLTPDVVVSDQVVHAWEDVKAMFNGGTRKRILASTFKTLTAGNVSDKPCTDVKQRKTASFNTFQHRIQPHGQQHSRKHQGGQQQQRRLQSLCTSNHSAADAMSESSLQTLHQQAAAAAAISASNSWFCAQPPLHPYAAFAAAASAAGSAKYMSPAQSSALAAAASGAPSWFTYPFLQAPMAPVLTAAAPTFVPGTSGTDRSNDIEPDQTAQISGNAVNMKLPRECKVADSAFNMVTTRNQCENVLHMTKEKLQELLMSEMRARQKLETDLMQLRGHASK